MLQKHAAGVSEKTGEKNRDRIRHETTPELERKTRAQHRCAER